MNEELFKEVVVFFRDFIAFFAPCTKGSVIPVHVATIMFEHRAVFFPGLDDQATYRSWKKGANVSTGDTYVGLGHVANILDPAKPAFCLNGHTHHVELNFSAELYAAYEGGLHISNNIQIRRAITSIFGPRIKDFSHNREMWKCEGSGLFTFVGSHTIALPKDFVPKDWNPYETLK